MTDFISPEVFETRLLGSISAAWAVFARKVGADLIPINKEASMQLQYAYLLKQILPLALHHIDETADLELETTMRTTRGANNIDILLKGSSAAGQVRIGIELKCYKTIAASGGSRGAHDIFMKDVYEDLQVLEDYIEEGKVSRGIALVMTDLKQHVLPTVKKGKCWAYDISDGHEYAGGTIDVPVGGKPVNVELRRMYTFGWRKFGNCWFANLEGLLPDEKPGAN